MGGGGGSNLDTGLLSDLEGDLLKLRQDLETHRTESTKQFRNVNDALDDKATKNELEQLEQRLMDKLQELLNNLGNVFVEKEPVRKKFLNIEKNVGFILFANSSA
jgi:predicted ribosome quality control (RQC) complex YloA/Tae2 family protein